jgi:Xaa-Pro aminopeptidase
MFFPKREFKNMAEIKKIARSMAATEQAMMLAKEILAQASIGKNMTLRHGKTIVTSEFLRMEIEGFLKARGFTASQTITAHGPQCSQPHNTGSGPILAGETVVVDIFPRDDESGYWGDMTRTFVKGEPLPVVKRAYEAVLEASQAAERMIRSGVIAAEVHNKAKEIMANAGFKTGKNNDGIPCGFIHGLGHGVGLEIHEAPRVSPANPKPLRKGQVISNEPGLYHPSWGGIRLEDVLVVKDDGVRNFFTMSKELIV